MKERELRLLIQYNAFMSAAYKMGLRDGEVGPSTDAYEDGYDLGYASGYMDGEAAGLGE